MIYNINYKLLYIYMIYNIYIIIYKKKDQSTDLRHRDNHDDDNHAC